MSAAYCSRSEFCGAQAMIFALPFAQSAFPEQYADGICYQIETFENIQNYFKFKSAILDELVI